MQAQRITCLAAQWPVYVPGMWFLHAPMNNLMNTPSLEQEFSLKQLLLLLRISLISMF